MRIGICEKIDENDCIIANFSILNLSNSLQIYSEMLGMEWMLDRTFNSFNLNVSVIATQNE